MTVPAANQVSSSSAAPPVAPPAEPARAPAGVGSAPTTISPSALVKEKGYVVTLLYVIRDFILNLYQKILSCWGKTTSVPAPTASPTPPPTAEEPPRAAAPAPEIHAQEKAHLQQLHSQPNFLELFNLYYPADRSKNKVYVEIAQRIPLNFREHWGFAEINYVEKGKKAVQERPELLRPYLVKRIESLLHREESQAST